MFWYWLNFVAYLANLFLVFVGYFADNMPGMILNGVVAILAYLWFQEEKAKLDN